MSMLRAKPKQPTKKAPVTVSQGVEVADAPAVHKELTVTLTRLDSATYTLFQKYAESLKNPDTAVLLLGADVKQNDDQSITVCLQDASPLNVFFKEIEIEKEEAVSEWQPLKFTADADRADEKVDYPNPQPMALGAPLAIAANNQKADDAAKPKAVVIDPVVKVQVNAAAPAVAANGAAANDVKDSDATKADKWREQFWDIAIKTMESAIKNGKFIELFKMLLGPETYQTTQELAHESHHHYYTAKEFAIKDTFHAMAHNVAEVYENKLHFEKVWQAYDAQIIKKLPDKILKLNAAIAWLNQFAGNDNKELVAPLVQFCKNRINHYQAVIKNFKDLKAEYYETYKRFEKNPEVDGHTINFEKFNQWVAHCEHQTTGVPREAIKLNGHQKAEFEALLNNSLTFIMEDTLKCFKIDYSQDTKGPIKDKLGLTDEQVKTNLIDPMLNKHEETAKALQKGFPFNPSIMQFNKDMNISKLREGLLALRKETADSLKHKIDANDEFFSASRERADRNVENFRNHMIAWCKQNANLIPIADMKAEAFVDKIICTGIGKLPLSMIKNPANGNTLMHELMRRYKTIDNAAEKMRILDLAETLYAHGSSPYALNLQSENAFEHAKVRLHSEHDWRLAWLNLKYVITFSSFAESVRKGLIAYVESTDKANFIKKWLRNEQITAQRLQTVDEICAAIANGSKKVDDQSIIKIFKEIQVSAKNKNWQTGFFGTSALVKVVDGIMHDLEERRLVAIGPDLSVQVKQKDEQIARLEASQARMQDQLNNVMQLLAQKDRDVAPAVNPNAGAAVGHVAAAPTVPSNGAVVGHAAAVASAAPSNGAADANKPTVKFGK